MRLLRLYLSELRLYQCRRLDRRAERALRRGIILSRKAWAIRRRERLYLGLDQLPPGASWRPPSIGAGLRRMPEAQ